MADDTTDVRAVIPYVNDPDFTLYVGDALEVLRELPDESVHCALTSPPFYALRDYGVEGQIGLEASPEEWAARLVDVFGEVRRVETFEERRGISRDELRELVAARRREQLARAERAQEALLQRLGREFRAERAHDGRSNQRGCE